MTLPHDSWAAHYEAVMELTFQELYARVTSSALDEVRARLRPPASIVDFGAGCGRLSIPLASERYRVTAVEPSLSKRCRVPASRRRQTPRRGSRTSVPSISSCEGRPRVA